MNFKVLSSFSLLLSSLCFANVTVNVKNLSLNYSDPKGSGSTTVLNFDGHDYKGAFVLEKIAGHVYFNFAGERAEWPEIQGLLKDADQASFNNFTLNISNTAISAQANSLNFAGGTSRTIINGLSGNCSGGAAQADFGKSLFSHCSKNGKLKFSSFEIQDFHKSLSGQSFWFNSLIEEILVQINSAALIQKGGAPKMSNLDLNVGNNNFNGSVEVALGISAKVDFSGRFDLIDNDTRLRIRLDKANVWIVSVADQIFNEIGKLNGVSVSRPYIYLKL